MITSVVTSRRNWRKSRRWPAASVLVSLLLGQTACVQLAEVDSTSAPIYASMIGREFELRENFVASGVKLPPKFDEVDYILIMPPPGIASKYRIVDLGDLPAGSRIRIVGVVTRRSELFHSTRYVISLLNHPLAGSEGRQIRIQDAAAWQLYVNPASPDAAPQLSENYFRPLADRSP